MANTNYAFIKNQTVVNVAVFDNPTSELLEQFKNEFELDEIVLTPHIYVAPSDSYVNGKFIAKKHVFDSWTFNEDTYSWEPPVAYPDDTLDYVWDEETTSWVLKD
jgi:UTP-glucose-1-phosphate uridylyltransferase